MSEREIRIRLGLGYASIVIGFAFLVFFTLPDLPQASAHDKHRPDLDDWYPTLFSKSGGQCCGGPKVDATPLGEPQWRRKNNLFEVFVEDQWVVVPADAIVNQPNKDGRVLVWFWRKDGRPVIRCFMPGVLS